MKKNNFLNSREQAMKAFENKGFSLIYDEPKFEQLTEEELECLKYNDPFTCKGIELNEELANHIRAKRGENE